MSDNTDFVLSVIGGLSGTVGLNGTQLQYIVDDAVESYGVSVEADATDETKLHILLRYYTWLKIRDELLLDPTAYKTDGESWQFDRALLDKRVSEAFAQASPYLTESDVTQDYIDLGFSPYRRSS